MANKNRRRRTSDAWHIMVLRQPITIESQLLHMLRQFHAVLERLCSFSTFVDRCQIKHSQRYIFEFLNSHSISTPIHSIVSMFHKNFLFPAQERKAQAIKR